MRKLKTFTLVALSLFTLTVKAQEATTIETENKEAFETTIAADIVSQFIWRGQDLGSISIQPTLGISYHGLSLTSWGSIGVNHSSDNKEIDLTLAYTKGRWNMGITDYWTTNGKDSEARYFKYDAHGTNHVFEANIGYNFGIASIQWFTIFAGNDGINDNGKRAYSSYLEAAVPFRFTGIDWLATAGVVPYATEYYETKGFAVTNLSLRATKSLQVTNSFSIPLFGELIANPRAQKAYLVFGFTLQP